MKTWDDLKKQITSLDEGEKIYIAAYAEIISNLELRKKDLGLTQRDLARKTGLKQSAIARVFSSVDTIPRLDTIIKIANSLGMKMTVVNDENK